jgi:hypothetical protein
MNILHWVWGLVKLAKTLILTTLLLASIALNLAFFTGGMIYSMASSAFEIVTGGQSIASKQAEIVADLSENINFEKKAKRELRGEFSDVGKKLVNEKKITRKLSIKVANVGENLVLANQMSKQLRKKVADISGELVNEKKITRKLGVEIADIGEKLVLSKQTSKQLRKEIANPNKRIVTYKGKKMALSQAVETTSGSIARRSAIAATRSVASMGGEALPVIGTSVIVAATGFELYDLCNTVKDMNDLKVAFDPSLKTEPEQTTICAMEVPTKEELWESTKASPGAAWNAAKTYTPTLEDIKNYEFPDADWTGMWAASKDNAGWLKDETVDTSKDAWAATTEGAGNLWGNISEGAGNLWSSEEEATKE